MAKKNEDQNLEFGPDTPAGTTQTTPSSKGSDAQNFKGAKQYLDDDSDDFGGDNTDDDSGKDTKDPKNDKKRYEYWQSQYNKLQDKVSQMEGAMQSMMQNNSNSQANQSNQNTSQQAMEQVQAEIKALKPPTMPKKPANYDQAEAFTNPDSESFKYNQEYQQYLSEMTNYMMKRDELRGQHTELQIESLKMPLQNLSAQTAQNQQQQKTVATLMKNYNFTVAQAQDFIQKMSDPSSLSLDNLVHFYRVQNGLKSHSPGQDDFNPGNRNPNRFAAPTFPNSSGGSFDSDIDEDRELEQGFAQGLLNFSKI